MSYLINPFLAAIITQIIKLFGEAVKGKFAWRRLNDYGGMPSSHTALVIGLLTQVIITAGVKSLEFAITAVFVFLVIRDALGLRAQLSYHALIVNKVIKNLPDKDEYNFPVLPEVLGHTLAQVIVGGILGALIVWTLNS